MRKNKTPHPAIENLIDLGKIIGIHILLSIPFLYSLSLLVILVRPGYSVVIPINLHNKKLCINCYN